MWLAKLTSKGQITIPKEVRERLGLKDQDRVLFTVDDEGARLHVVRRPTVAGLAGRFTSALPYPSAESIRDEVGRALGRARAEEATECPAEPI